MMPNQELTQATSYAEDVFQQAGEHGAKKNVHAFFALKADDSSAASSNAPSSDDLNSLLNNFGVAPGASTVVTVPTAPIDGDMSLVQIVQTLDSYIATLTALVMYNNHPNAYDLSDKAQAAQFVIDLANARNYVVTGGNVKTIPMYLPMGETTTQSVNKSTTSADLHIDLLSAMFGSLGLPTVVLNEMDGVLTDIADTLKSLQMSFSTQTQRLNHFVSFYHLVPVDDPNFRINQMNVDFIYLQMDQSSWVASAGKSTVSNFTLDVTITKTTATMSAGIVAADAGNIVNSLMQLTGNDITTISKMTKMNGVRV